VVVLTHQLEDRHLQIVEVNVLAVQFQFVPVELVVLIDVFEELDVGFAGHVDAVAEPLLHPAEVLDEALVVHILGEADVLRDVVLDGVHQGKAHV
jgi:hypothetical protein